MLPKDFVYDKSNDYYKDMNIHVECSDKQVEEFNSKYTSNISSFHTAIANGNAKINFPLAIVSEVKHYLHFGTLQKLNFSKLCSLLAFEKIFNSNKLREQIEIGMNFLLANKIVSKEQSLEVAKTYGLKLLEANCVERMRG